MTSILVTAAVLVPLFFFLHHLLVPSHDPEEPPLVQPKVPLIGHVIGLLKSGNSYYANIAKQCGKPIFTLGLPRGKMYIVTSPDLAVACDRRAKIVSFAPYVVAFADRILAASKESVNLLSEDLTEEKGAATLRPHTMKTMHQELGPGFHLDELMQVVLGDISKSLDTVIMDGNQAVVPMFQWIKSFVSLAGTNALYGLENNPLKDPNVMSSFWTVDKDFALLGLKIFPDLIAPAGNRGRERFFDAFRKYYATGGVDTASHLIKARHRVNKEHGVSKEDIAHFDLGVCTAMLVNTVPAVWWTLYHAFSDRTLLTELRSGIETAVSSQHKPFNMPSTATIDISHIVATVPLLSSFVKEVLRIHSNSMSARILLDDRVIESDTGTPYLLKKNAFLAMPSEPVHNSPAAWGTNASSFEPARFMRPGGDKVPKSAYRVFGGGSALCPGRHLAMNEILTVLVIMVLRYDVEPLEGAWDIPKTRFHISTTIMTPEKDFHIKIQPRERIEAQEWSFSWNTAK